jgi:hypothetical protein
MLVQYFNKILTAGMHSCNTAVDEQTGGRMGAGMVEG